MGKIKMETGVVVITLTATVYRGDNLSCQYQINGM